MAKRLVLSSLKGGTGKTTLVYNLAPLLAQRFSPVLCVDCDPQGNLTSAFVTQEEVAETALTARLFEGKSVTPLAIGDNLSVLCADRTLTIYDARVNISDLKRLGEGLAALDCGLILLDAPTGLRPLSTAALFAADAVVTPVDPSPFAVSGVLQLVELLVRLKDRHGHSVEFLGVVLNAAERRTRITQQVMETLKTAFGEERFLGCLMRSVKARESALYRTPLVDLASNHPLTQQFEELSNAIVRRLSR